MILLFITIFLTLFLGFMLSFLTSTSTTPKGWRIFDYLGYFVSSVFGAVYLCIPVFLLYHFLIKNYVPAYIFMPALCMLIFLLNYLNVRPAPPLNFKKETKKREKQLKLIFKNYSPIIPDEEIKIQDLKFLKEELGKFITRFDFGDNERISTKDANHFKKLYDFIKVGGSLPYKQISLDSKMHKRLLKAANTIEFHFISYSPNGQYFICYYTFRSYANHLKKDIDTPRILFGEKMETGIHLYQYVRLFKQYCIEKEHKYKFFTGWDKLENIIHNLDRGSLSREFDYPRHNPMDPLFWKDPNFFSKVTVDGIEYDRFKTNNMYDGSNIKYPYTLREHLMFKFPSDGTNKIN